MGMTVKQDAPIIARVYVKMLAEKAVKIDVMEMQLVIVMVVLAQAIVKK